MGGIINPAGEKYKVVKGKKFKPGRSKSGYEITCEIANETTAEVRM